MIARLQARFILRLRLVHQEQFHHMTQADWDQLETINRAAMRTITGLHRFTPIRQLQAHAQLNTLDQIIHHCRSARLLKPGLVSEAAALAPYMG